MIRALLKERQLQMIWAVERDGSRSYLIGTAHLFPYHFRSCLRRYIGESETVLLEGPLDDESMRRVAESGQGEERSSLYEALDAKTIRRINQELGAPHPPRSSDELCANLLQDGPDDWLAGEIRGLRPWMAFYRVWLGYLKRQGWKYTVDVDASKISVEMGKEVHLLETIEEQIAALEGIPLERIVAFFENVDWGTFGREYVRRYLAGDLQGIVTMAGVFPALCESVVARRDPILCARMSPFLKRGNAIAFVGAIHCPGIMALLLEDGYQVVSPRSVPLRLAS